MNNKGREPSRPFRFFIDGRIAKDEFREGRAALSKLRWDLSESLENGKCLARKSLDLPDSVDTDAGIALCSLP